jgi:hypothetical protein
MDAHAAEALLDEFRKVPGRVERPQTFMEIAGYPHYEDVCSNFLAFFFDPKGLHGLGNLLLDALMDSVSMADRIEGFGGNVSVKREVVTAAGNRIDILVTSDSRAVLIENKIFAAIVNPFDDYVAYLNGLKDENGVAYEEEKRSKILLTLQRSDEGKDYGFVNLTHSDFASAVRSRLGHYVTAADARYLTLMLDFLNTLESLGKGTRMNQQFVMLLAERSREVTQLLTGINEVRGELREKVKALETLVDVGGYQNVEQLPWSPNPNVSLVHFLQHRVRIDGECYVVVEPVISPGGWQIRIFSRGPQDRPKLQDVRNEVRDELEIPPENEGPFIHPRRFDYDADLSRVAAAVREILDKISRSVG